MITLQNLVVEDAYQLCDESPIKVRMTDDISLVVKNFSQHGELRGIFVVDGNDRYLGMITRSDLFDWARVKFGDFFLEPLKDSNKTFRLINLINASIIGEMLRPETKNATVFTKDSLHFALKKMIETDLIILPVIDQSQCIIGQITISELLNKLIISESEG